MPTLNIYKYFLSTCITVLCKAKTPWNVIVKLEILLSILLDESDRLAHWILPVIPQDLYVAPSFVKPLPTFCLRFYVRMLEFQLRRIKVFLSKTVVSSRPLYIIKYIYGVWDVNLFLNRYYIDALKYCFVIAEYKRNFQFFLFLIITVPCLLTCRTSLHYFWRPAASPTGTKRYY